MFFVVNKAQKHFNDRINDLDLAKQYFEADYILRPKTTNDYIFLETIQDLEYETTT